MYQIMLVEDEMLVRESMAQNTNWGRFGFAAPHVFENGQQALEQLETLRPDVVITDICMPFVDGLELAQHIYETLPETIVVVLTGFSEFLMPRGPSGITCTTIFSKPVSPREFDQLLQSLAAELSEKRERQGVYSRAAVAGEVLKDRFFQSLLQPELPQELNGAMREAGVEFGGGMHAVVLAALPEGPIALDEQEITQLCAPAQFRVLEDQHAMLIVSGEDTAELMARTAAGARQLCAQLEKGAGAIPVGIGGAYSGLDGLRRSAQEAQHALGYAFSSGQTLLFDPELRKSSGSLQTEDCPTAAMMAHLRCSPARRTARWS